jgi:phosphoglycerate-specific signal transduction histidine kinase
LVSLISEASTLREPTEFKRIQDLLKAASDGVRQSAAKLANNDVTAITEQLLPLGTSANSIFARHARETFVATRADATIDENVAIQRDLDETVANLVSEAEGGVKRSTAMLNEALDHSRLLLLIVVFISIIAAVGVGILYVQRRLVQRLVSISNVMRLLASGQRSERSSAGRFPFFPRQHPTMCGPLRMRRKNSAFQSTQSTTKPLTPEVSSIAPQTLRAGS